MTTGSPIKLIILYTIPILLGDIFQQMYSMVDTIIVGKLLGTNALAAVGSTGPMNFLVLGFLFGLTSGFAVISAQRFGAKDADGLRRSVAMNIMLNAFSTVVLTVLACALTMPILKWINTPEEILEDAFNYIFIVFAGIGASVLYNSASCLLRAVGDSKSPLFFLIISSLLNIVLDVVLIYYAKMGVSGAAWATVISQAVAGVLSLLWIIIKYPELHVRKEDFAWSTSFAIQHLKMGLNMGFQFSITAIGVVVLQGALNIFGAVKIAGFTTAQKVSSLATVAAGAFGITMANYAGQNLGAAQVERIKEGCNKACLITVIFSVVSAVLAIIFYKPLIGLFLQGEQPAVLEAARIYLVISCPFYPILFVLFIYRNVLQSIGRGFWPLMGGVFELVARTIGAYTLPKLWDYGGICASEPLAWVSATVPLGIAYYIIMKNFKLKTLK